MGRYVLGLSEQEFWSLNDRQFRALVERHKQRQEDELYLAAMISANIDRKSVV